VTDPESSPVAPSTSRQRHAEFRIVWRTLSFYERFEVAISITLTTLIALIILLATLDLASAMITLVRTDLPKPLDHRLFQAFFGQIMTLLIALEFKHSIIKAVAQRENIIQVRTVLLIALLAISRKFIILDLSEYSPMSVMALAASVTALGVTHWLVRDRQDRGRPNAT
jgi:uncharacterized membrane protein (DUF373 family)